MRDPDVAALNHGSLPHRLEVTFNGRLDEDEADERARAAVAIVVCPHENELGFLLTMRAATLTRHANQFALPGGRLDEGESYEGAALRELQEELGMALERSAIIGRLPDYHTRSGYRIRPFVFWQPVLEELRPDPAEVAETFHVPLAELAAPGVPRLISARDLEKPVIQIPLGDELVHAPTGAIIHQFGQAAIAERFVDAREFEEPRFAWS